MAIPRPKWFSDDHVMISTAPTCGLTKGGRLLRKVDRATGKRVMVKDDDTGEQVEAIDDVLLHDMEALSRLKAAKANSRPTDTLAFIASDKISLQCAVPVYYDQRYTEAFRSALKTESFQGFSSATIGDLVKTGKLVTRGGHGSPSQEQRVGEVPYIKVSDLRAGLVNINPTNRVPKAVAEKFWRGKSSGLKAYDLLCPERTSKNIGDFCVLMPGQEQVLTTKEVIVLRPGPEADFDPFYILWAMTLKIVRDQWKRVVFMQTNREDVGGRFLEIEIPVPPNRKRADNVSESFRKYFQSISTARSDLQKYLQSTPSPHHFFVSGAEQIEAAESGVDGELSDQASEG